MDEHKAKAIEKGDAAGEAYAKEKFLSGGIAAMRAMVDPMQIAVDEEHYLKHDVHPLRHKEFVQTFCRCAARYRDAVLLGYEHEGIPYPEDRMHAIHQVIAQRPELYAQITAAKKAEKPDATTDELCEAVIDHFDCRAMGDTPERIAAYRAGVAARKAEASNV